ncbi:MAG TPA: hypothetical protein VJ770_00820 [Stellaceae bacterium]|nr:hypothetical protein [Stellaceae bacterium]
MQEHKRDMQHIVRTTANELARFARSGAMIVNFSAMPSWMYTDFREDH